MASTYKPLITLERSVIPAADVPISRYYPLVRAVAGVKGIQAIKIGFQVGLKGLSTAVEQTKNIAGEDFKVIYDHQKAATDIPDTGKNFAEVMADAGVDAAILFPQAGPKTQEAWTKALQEKGIRVIVGGEMTHPGYLDNDGGYLKDTTPLLIFERAVEMGVTDFVVPGNKVESVQLYRGFFDAKLGEGNYAFYAPGFITQGGDLSETGKVAGRRVHGIIGRALTEAGNEDAIHEAAFQLTAQIAG